jgi:hypothetical protein
VQRLKLSLGSTQSFYQKAVPSFQLQYIYDEFNAHTLSATFDWFIQREKKSDLA